MPLTDKFKLKISLKGHGSDPENSVILEAGGNEIELPVTDLRVRAGPDRLHEVFVKLVPEELEIDAEGELITTDARLIGA